MQRAGLPGDCLYPACLNIRPPSPANGAAHSLQRGGDGMRRNNRRWQARPARRCPVATSRRLIPHAYSSACAHVSTPEPRHLRHGPSLGAGWLVTKVGGRGGSYTDPDVAFPVSVASRRLTTSKTPPISFCRFYCCPSPALRLTTRTDSWGSAGTTRASMHSFTMDGSKDESCRG